MLTMLGSPRRCCDGWTRRETLKAGTLGLLGGLTLPQLLQAEERRPRRPAGRVRNVILLYLLGGAATQDMIDLKPGAPTGIRSEFRPIPTSAPGVQICEHLPLMSRWMHKIALVRSLNHKAGCHNTLPSYTGHESLLSDIVSTRDTYPPSMGSICEWLRLQNLASPSPLRAPPSRTRGEMPNGRGEGSSELPDYAYLPCYLGWGQAIRRPGPYGGFLGQRCDPLFTECTPSQDPGAPRERAGYPGIIRGVPRLPDSNLPADLTIDRLNSRRSLLQQLDSRVQQLDSSPAFDQFNRTQQRAFSLLTSSRVRSAFSLDHEDPRLVDRYGRTLFGNSALIARRLVEAGVRFVNVTWDIYWERLQLNYDGWDTHTRNFAILREHNLPTFDQTYSTLLQDLHDRGLLDETLVVVMSEMGRTPRVNGNAGRDHWTYCYGMWFAGAGIRGGSVCGESDSQAAYVKDRPVSTADVCATIYECLGIDPDMTVPDRSGRPHQINHGGRPLREILG